MIHEDSRLGELSDALPLSPAIDGQRPIKAVSDGLSPFVGVDDPTIPLRSQLRNTGLAECDDVALSPDDDLWLAMP
jgi:hypothetical protein